MSEIGIFGNKEKLVSKAIKELKTIKSNPNNDVIPKEIWQEIEKLRKQAGLSTRKFHAKLGWAYSGTSRHKNGISRDRLKDIVKVVNNKLLKDLLHQDVYWDFVKSIRKIGIEDVYDIEVPKNHNFIANDIVVHNSIEQDSDVVMFIYREDLYQTNTPPTNIADIIIAKHRNGPVGRVQLHFDSSRTNFSNLDKRYGDQQAPPPPPPSKAEPVF